jgi:hypothetical protein
MSTNATMLRPAKKPSVPAISNTALIRGRRIVKRPAKKRLMEIATDAPWKSQHISVSGSGGQKMDLPPLCSSVGNYR